MKKFFNFETFITPVLIKILYPTILVIGFLMGLSMLSEVSRYSGFLGGGVVFFSLLMGIISYIVFALILRVTFEQIMVFFNINKNLHKFVNSDDTSVNYIDSVSELKTEIKNLNDK